MRNPKTVQLAQVIAETFPHLLVERDANVVTLEDTEGERYLVTVESMFNATETETASLPDPGE